MALTRGQQSILQICTNFDIKGKMSGKHAISTNGKPVDVLGYMLQDLGYRLHTTLKDGHATTPHGQKLDPYIAARQELNLRPGFAITKIWREIDRTDSTNESIRQKIIKVCRISEEDAAPYQPYKAPEEH